MNRRFAIDIEASGFYGWPIELGWCEIGSDKPRSMLIRPEMHDDAWSLDYWDPRAQEVHGISLEQLMRDGYPARVVAAQFSLEIGPDPILYSDSVIHDQRWLDILFLATPHRAPRLTYTRHNAEGGHRAGPDALDLAQKIARDPFP